jgi:hypothetical protein
MKTAFEKMLAHGRVEEKCDRSKLPKVERQKASIPSDNGRVI